MKPDCCGTGYNLTPLGSLVYGPWQADGFKYNVAVFLEDKEISSIGKEYSPLQKNLVFELLQDGSVKYWLKSDYDSALIKKTSPDSSGVSTVTNDVPNGNQIKKVFHAGRWLANFKDSSLKIDFGKDANEVPPMIGKYGHLGSSSLWIQEISYFDSTFSGKSNRLKKVITTYYSHPWINKFDE
jgi:hypothetical protein